jgi:TrmH family RNA methyltransferase
MIEINSRDNPRVKQWMKLRKRKKDRQKQGAFIVEGAKAVLDLPGDQVLAYIVEQGQTQWVQAMGHLDKLCLVSKEIYQALTLEASPQGVMAVVTMVKEDLAMDKLSNQGVYIALENIQDPGNLGTIIRSADAAGAQGVFLSRTSVDLYHPKVVKASMASISHLPIYQGLEFSSLVEGLIKKGLPLVAAHLQGARPYDQVDYRDGVCFFIGNEGQGLSDKISQKISNKVVIPMRGQAESLNAGVAASILLFEARRQLG